MAIREILTYPDPFLRRRVDPVIDFDDALQTAIDDMAETMYAAPGMGLAASQVGINQQILIYDISPKEETADLQVLINPVIVDSGGSQLSENEGCLSVPDFRADVKRREWVIVNAADRYGKPLTIEDSGLHAIVLQHEIDHLNGVLFIDHISSLKRQMYKRRIKKQLREMAQP